MDAFSSTIKTVLKDLPISSALFVEITMTLILPADHPEENGR
jgi:hypothetical protein